MTGHHMVIASQYCTVYNNVVLIELAWRLYKQHYVWGWLQSILLHYAQAAVVCGVLIDIEISSSSGFVYLSKGDLPFPAPVRHPCPLFLEIALYI